MVQRSTPAKDKLPAGPRAAKKPAGGRGTKSTRPRKTTTASAADKPSDRAVSKALERLGTANALLEGRRKDLEALVQAKKTSYEGLQAVVTRCTELLQEAIAEWRLVAKMMNAVGTGASVAKLDELATGAFQMALENIRELAELAATSQAAAFEIVKQRTHENVDAVSKLLKRS